MPGKNNDQREETTREEETKSQADVSGPHGSYLTRKENQRSRLDKAAYPRRNQNDEKKSTKKGD